MNAAITALRDLVRAVSELPENACGTTQGGDLNSAYQRACAALESAQCQHDKTKPEPTLHYMHTANDGHKWRCAICDGRFTTPFTTTGACEHCECPELHS